MHEHRSTPAALYKYFGARRIRNLFVDRQIRFTQPGDLNDPFEMKPLIDIKKTASGFFQNPEFVSQIRDRVEANVGAPLPAWIDWQSVVTHYADTDLSFTRTIEALGHAVMEMTHQAMDQTLGVLCLSEDPLNLVMWALYCESHTGFVAGFDSNHSFFHQHPSGHSNEYGHPLPVYYGESRPNPSLSEMTEREFLLTKSSHWSFEREWRMFQLLKNRSTTCRGEGGYEIHLFDVPPKAISEVIIGHRSMEAHREAWDEALSTDFCHVRIYMATPDSETFALKKVPLRT